MFNFFKNINLNVKSKLLVHNFLEPLLGKGMQYCKGAAETKGFSQINEENDRLTFVRQDVTQKLILGLDFNQEGNCSFYILTFNNPGESLMHSKFLDSYSVRESGLVKD